MTHAPPQSHECHDDTPSTVIHLFPGQGDFAVSALVRAIRTTPGVREAVADVFGQVEEVGKEFGIAPLAPSLLSNRPPSGRDLAQGPVGTYQLALYCSSLAVHRALCAAGLTPDRIVGVSFGEIAALTAAGVFSTSDGARIACLLSRYLYQCEGGMSLLGAGEEQAERLLREWDSPSLVLACVNDPGETVLSGPVTDLEGVENLARRQGLPVVRLRLPFASHHPSFTGQADAFAAAIRSVPARRARLPVHSAVRGGPYTPRDDLHRALADCLVRPARLPKILHQVTMSARPLLLEAGTGWALTRNVRHTVAPSAARALAPIGEPGFAWAPTTSARDAAVLAGPALPATERWR